MQIESWLDVGPYVHAALSVPEPVQTLGMLTSCLRVQMCINPVVSGRHTSSFCMSFRLLHKFLSLERRTHLRLGSPETLTAHFPVLGLCVSTNLHQEADL